MCEEVHETQSATPNFQTELAAQLAELMPEVIADGKVDVEKLKELLGGDATDTTERFGLFWPGKKRALRAAQEPTTATLRPDFENSKDWDTTKNVFIEGDNLEVLKILQKHYHAKIKMIYIDPPYNTGKDFVYPDNYKEGLDTYLEWTRQVNEEGKKLSTNAETEGRYHSNWLNMMYPRLKLARNLLTQDGVIFISIDDHEVAQLRRLGDEIFGESAFLGQIVWKKKTNGNNMGSIPPVHDYILAYARTSLAIPDIGYKVSAEELGKGYSNPDNDARGPWKTMDLSANHEGPYFRITNPITGDSHFPPEGRYWVFSEDEVKTRIADGRIIFGKSGNARPVQKVFLGRKAEGKKRAESWWDKHGMNSDATDEIRQLFGQAKVFSHPKPTQLISHLVEISTEKNSVVLDFFSGSGTTAHATMLVNAKDGGCRTHIQVQLPEPVQEKDEAYKAGYRTISGLARKRIELAASKIIEDSAVELGQRETPLDVGFRAYRLMDTNFSKWKQSSDIELNQLEQHMLDLRESSSADDSSADDLLAEILLKQGNSLVERIAPIEVSGLVLHSVRDGLVLAYLNEHVKPTLEQLRAVTNEDPERLIFLEDAFQGDDQLKTNLAQLCKSKGIELWTA
ncbi:site-specific DNA-methyltransferase [Glutamicibacter bergerei]|uniref:Site-specific DNA-methyltransferase n=2 Tax=Glutamicibacter bergerei TaxID=256702 RepID=A0ABV9MKH8_9MICC|nr:site-specific DNA-methyltransferase [Micrococcaceae bacterium]